jgi:hypothetical protein
LFLVFVYRSTLPPPTGHLLRANLAHPQVFSLVVSFVRLPDGSATFLGALRMRPGHGLRRDGRTVDEVWRGLAALHHGPRPHPAGGDSSAGEPQHASSDPTGRLEPHRRASGKSAEGRKQQQQQQQHQGSDRAGAGSEKQKSPAPPRHPGTGEVTRTASGSIKQRRPSFGGAQLKVDVRAPMPSGALLASARRMASALRPLDDDDENGSNPDEAMFTGGSSAGPAAAAAAAVSGSDPGGRGEIIAGGGQPPLLSGARLGESEGSSGVISAELRKLWGDGTLNNEASLSQTIGTPSRRVDSARIGDITSALAAASRGAGARRHGTAHRTSPLTSSSTGLHAHSGGRVPMSARHIGYGRASSSANAGTPLSPSARVPMPEPFVVSDAQLMVSLVSQLDAELLANPMVWRLKRLLARSVDPSVMRRLLAEADGGVKRVIPERKVCTMMFMGNVGGGIIYCFRVLYVYKI